MFLCPLTATIPFLTRRSKHLHNKRYSVLANYIALLRNHGAEPSQSTYQLAVQQTQAHHAGLSDPGVDTRRQQDSLDLHKQVLAENQYNMGIAANASVFRVKPRPSKLAKPSCHSPAASMHTEPANCNPVDRARWAPPRFQPQTSYPAVTVNAAAAAYETELLHAADHRSSYLPASVLTNADDAATEDSAIDRLWDMLLTNPEVYGAADGANPDSARHVQISQASTKALTDTLTQASYQKHTATQPRAKVRQESPVPDGVSVTSTPDVSMSRIQVDFSSFNPGTPHVNIRHAASYLVPGDSDGTMHPPTVPIRMRQHARRPNNVWPATAGQTFGIRKDISNVNMAFQRSMSVFLSRAATPFASGSSMAKHDRYRLVSGAKRMPLRQADDVPYLKDTGVRQDSPRTYSLSESPHESTAETKFRPGIRSGSTGFALMADLLDLELQYGPLPLCSNSKSVGDLEDYLPRKRYRSMSVSQTNNLSC